MEIREAFPTDYPVIAELHTRSWQRFYRGIWSDAYLDSNLLEERERVWKARLEQPAYNQRVLLALEDNAPVGFVCLYLQSDAVHGSLIDNLHVAASYRGKGLGRLLMREAAGIIEKESGDKRLFLWVLEDNSQARVFYERMGGVFVERIMKATPYGGSSAACRYAWVGGAIG